MLAKRTKDELIDILVEWARENRHLLRRLAERIDLEAPPQELAAATRQAIADATDFDEREINRNFAYDYQAYREVKRGLGRLIDSGELRLAMELSLELMKQGSYVLKKCDLPASEVAGWCAEMLQRDRVGFICQQELRALRDHFQASRGK